MCLETMDSRSKHIKPDCLRKTMKPGSKLTWGLLRVSAEKEHEALKPRVKGSVRKYLRRQQRRAQLAKISQIFGDMGRNEKEEIPAVAYDVRHPAGAMAPMNTTQYLMSNAYEDMKLNNTQTAPVCCDTSAQLYDESLSPRSVYLALDSGYESCLAFQQRDFDEMFDLCW